MPPLVGLSGLSQILWLTTLSSLQICLEAVKPVTNLCYAQQSIIGGSYAWLFGILVAPALADS